MQIRYFKDLCEPCLNAPAVETLKLQVADVDYPLFCIALAVVPRKQNYLFHN